MASESAQESPPPLIQDPEDSSQKPVFLSKKEDPSQLDMTKVMAAVGFILTITIIILGLMWVSVQNLEQRVAELETSTDSDVTVTRKSASDAAAKVASKASTRSTIQEE